MVEKWLNILSKFNSEVIPMELRGVWSLAKVEDREFPQVFLYLLILENPKR